MGVKQVVLVVGLVLAGVLLLGSVLGTVVQAPITAEPHPIPAHPLRCRRASQARSHPALCRTNGGHGDRACRCRDTLITL